MYSSKKIEASNLSQFNIYALKHQVKGLLYPKFLELIFEETHYTVFLMYTHCFFGGKRSWFTCPLCKSRVGVLYKHDDRLGCRECFNLTYHSRNISKKLRNDNIFFALGLFIKADELQQKIKRTFYAGEITNKLRKVEKLYYQAFLVGYSPVI